MGALMGDGGPERAHTLIAKVGADDATSLARELYILADHIERGELTVGVSGAPSGGAIYSYKVLPKTHDDYFREVEAWLDRERSDD